jgi:DNA-binding NtrC family response regulator
MVGRDPAMLAVYRLVRRAAPTELPVVIVGETGTGKELVARAVHELSGFRDGPFIDVHCAAVPETLAEAELFGWERGAFTGAVHQNAGLLESADGGTLLFDEGCSLSRGLQAKLLRAIEQQQFRRLGGRSPRTARFRLITALSKTVEALVANGTLRDDFGYRVAGVTVELPPLRTRRADISLLAEHYLAVSNRNGHLSSTLEPQALEILTQHAWPGNVRELKGLMEQLAALTDGPRITASDVVRVLPVDGELDRGRQRLAATLEAFDWNVRRAAGELGVSRTTLYGMLKRHGLQRPEPLPAECSPEHRGMSN